MLIKDAIKAKKRMQENTAKLKQTTENKMKAASLSAMLLARRSLSATRLLSVAQPLHPLCVLPAGNTSTVSCNRRFVPRLLAQHSRAFCQQSSSPAGPFTVSATAAKATATTFEQASRSAISQDSEIKDPGVIFDLVWSRIEQEVGNDNMVFPREV